MHARHVCDVGYTALWELELAQSLGYYIPTNGEKPDLTRAVLPMHPFTVLGPLVIVRELVLNEDGTALFREYRPRYRRRIRFARARRWIL